MIVKSGHHSVLEHEIVSVKLVCDRGVSHELVRHRLAAYSQESTRYCDYRKHDDDNEPGISVIRPFFYPKDSDNYALWYAAMKDADRAYMSLRHNGSSPQEARSVLPNSLKTEVVSTMNLREWRHVFEVRCSKAAHPQMRQMMLPLLDHFHN